MKELSHIICDVIDSRHKDTKSTFINIEVYIYMCIGTGIHMYISSYRLALNEASRG